MATFTRRGTRWQARVRRQGQPPRTKSFTRKSDAQAWAYALELQHERGRALPDAQLERRTLAQAAERFISVTLPTRQRNRNHKNTTRILRWWSAQLGDYALSRLTPDVIAHQRDMLCLGGRQPGTVNRYLTALSSLLNTARNEWCWVDFNPMKGVKKLREPQGRVRFLDDEERARVLNACRESQSRYLYTIVVLAISTGMRQGEILNLHWPEVDLHSGRILISTSKNGERRSVPLVGHACHLLKALKRVRQPDTSYVFPSQDGTRHAQIRMSWYAALERAQVEDFRFHDLRHCAASYLAMGGASLLDISTILGHKTLAMVQRYSHLSDQHTQAVMAKMNRQIFG